MSTTNISAADKTILDILAKDATLTHAQLAAMVGCAEAEVTERIRVLESLGVIKGYQAIIDWEKVDENKATALIQLKVVPEPDQGFDKLAHRIMQFEEVEGVYLMSGGYDLTVVLQGKSMRDIALFVARRLSALEGVHGTGTHFILSRYKDRDVIFHDEAVKEKRSNVFND